MQAGASKSFFCLREDPSFCDERLFEIKTIPLSLSKSESKSGISQANLKRFPRQILYTMLQWCWFRQAKQKLEKREMPRKFLQQHVVFLYYQEHHPC